MYSYQSGFDYSGTAAHKPGMVCHALAMQWNRGRGAASYDLLAGTNQLKRRIAQQADELCWEGGLGYGNGWCPHWTSPTLTYSGSGDVTIAFDYFKAFKGADKLDVTVIGPKGQSSFVVTRERPVLDLGGLS